MRNDVHVVHRQGLWRVDVEGSGESSRHLNKEAAVAAGRRLGRQLRSELYIHGLDGRIQERETYRRDPYPPPG
ncbi:MAG: hypothetical protein QOI31_1720 [Solirubrobacterales bacterium]|jgi:hypothetical protein|nr:hypothetical protein [Solirubrobacterales bacterium]